MRQHHALVIEGAAEEGVARALAWAARELGVATEQNPDVVLLRYSVLTVEDARHITTLALGGPLGKSAKVLIIVADRLYHEAQNALLKLFEEPPQQTFLFLVLPSLGGLLPTLRSRVQLLVRGVGGGERTQRATEVTEFLYASREQRSARIKKLTSGKDEGERHENREKAISLLCAIEAVLVSEGVLRHAQTLSEIATLRTYLYDRSAPVKMILEHVSLVVPVRAVGTDENLLY